MLDLDCVEQLGNAASGDQFGNGVFWNCSRALLANATDQDFLHGVSNNFACATTGPPSCWSVEAATFPPRRIPTSGMHCCLEAAGQRLPKLIASHQQTLAMGGTCLVEFGLLLIRLVIVEAVLGPSSLPFRLQCL